METKNTSANATWYFITNRYCPICGFEKSTRERRIGSKPSKKDDRFTEEPIPYHCGR